MKSPSTTTERKCKWRTQGERLLTQYQQAKRLGISPGTFRTRTPSDVYLEDAIWVVEQDQYHDSATAQPLLADCPPTSGGPFCTCSAADAEADVSGSALLPLKQLQHDFQRVQQHNRLLQRHVRLLEQQLFLSATQTPVLSPPRDNALKLRISQKYIDFLLEEINELRENNRASTATALPP